jgi:hypothetical protein
MKNRLNKQGKKLQEQVVEKVIQKYLPDILKVERETIESLAASLKANKDDKELTKMLQDKQRVTTNIQSKKLDVIHKSIDNFLDNASSSLNKKIEASKMTDKNKLNLKNYWLLLQTQIKLNAYNYISKAVLADVKKSVNNNEKALKLYNENSFITKNNTSKTEVIKQDIEKNKTIVQQAEEEIKKNPEVESKTITPEVGKKYKFTNAKGEVVEFTVKTINTNGSILGTKADGKDYVYDKSVIAKLSSAEPEAETKTPETTTPEPSKEEIKKRGGKVSPKL